MRTTRVVAVAAMLILATGPVVVAMPAPDNAPPAVAYKLTFDTQPNGRPIIMRWNPCRVHTYKVNLAAVPGKSRSAVLAETHAAVKTLAAKTGMSFSYRGLTGEVPRMGSGAKQTADVVIAYTTPAKTNIPLGATALAQGGPSVYGEWRPAGGTSYTTAITKGSMVIDTPSLMRDVKTAVGVPDIPAGTCCCTSLRTA